MLDEIMELVFSVTAEIIDDAKYKNPRVRTWLLTGLFTLFGLFVVGAFLWMTLSVTKNTAGVVVMGILTVIAAIVMVVVIVRGHKKNWI